MAESKSRVSIVPRLNAIVNEPDLRLAILGSVQSMGFDSPTENQTSAIEIFVRGHDVLISLPTGSGKSVCFASLPWVFDRLRQTI